MTTVAQTILDQLGGSKFIAMTGTSNILTHPHGVRFKIGRNSSGVRCVDITLTAMGDYVVEFFGPRGKPLAYAACIHNDTLADVFKWKTGMDVTL